MRNLRKRALLGALAAAAALALPGAWAQTWPSRSVSIIVPFPAGGTTDVLARALGQELSKTLGQPVVVENKPGAGATLGADYVAKAKADGYTLLMGAVHHTIATSVYRKLGYDFEKDFAPITTVALVPNVLVVNPQVPAKTVQELLAQAKAQPGKLTYGSNRVMQKRSTRRQRGVRIDFHGDFFAGIGFSIRFELPKRLPACTATALFAPRLTPSPPSRSILRFSGGCMRRRK